MSYGAFLGAIKVSFVYMKNPRASDISGVSGLSTVLIWLSGHCFWESWLYQVVSRQRVVRSVAPSTTATSYERLIARICYKNI